MSPGRLRPHACSAAERDAAEHVCLIPPQRRGTSRDAIALAVPAPAPGVGADAEAFVVEETSRDRDVATPRWRRVQERC